MHFVVLSAVFLLLILLVPLDKSVMLKFDLTSFQFHSLLVLYVLPFFGIWFAAFYAYVRLQSYSEVVKDSPEGRGFDQLARGCGWLAYVLPISALVSVILYGISNLQPDFKPTTVIISNYVNLVLPLIAYYFLGQSARTLAQQNGALLSLKRSRAISVIFLILGLAYCLLSLREFKEMTLTSAANPYLLPAWLAIITVALPYLLSWFIGLLAAYQLTTYARLSKGLIYRQALKYIGYGIAVVIASSIAFQYVTTIVPVSANSTMNYAFTTGYMIRFLAIFGFILIIVGATKLKRIEDI